MIVNIVLGFLTVLVGLVGYTIFALYKKITGERDALKDFPSPPEVNSIWGHFSPDWGTQTGMERRREYGAKYGPCYKLRFGPLFYMAVVCHPDTVKAVTAKNDLKAPESYDALMPWIGGSILVTMGKRWQRSRKMLTPAFHLDILREYVVVNSECTNILISKWQAAAKSSKYGKSIEVYDDTKKLVLDVLMRCIFSQQTECQTASGTKHVYVNAAHKLIDIANMRIFNVLYNVPAIFNFVYGKEFRKYCDIVHDYSLEVIRKRKAALQRQANSGATAEDVKGLEAYYENSTKPNSDAEDFGTYKKRKVDFIDILLKSSHEDGSPVDETDIQPEVDMFMFAGHDTTSTSLTWALYHLALHQDIQQKCRDEVLNVLRNRDHLEYDDLAELPFTTMCIKETLRLSPSVPDVGRKLGEDVQLPDGRVLPKGANVFIAISVLHNNPLVWENPNMFDPTRFEPERAAQRPSHAFVPFSAGPRNCIGQFFAMNILKTALAMLVAKFTFTVDPTKEYVFNHGVISRPARGMHLVVKPVETQA